MFSTSMHIFILFSDCSLKLLPTDFPAVMNYSLELWVRINLFSFQLLSLEYLITVTEKFKKKKDNLEM